MIASSLLSGALSLALAVSGAPVAAAVESSPASVVHPAADIAGYGGLIDLFGYQSTLAGTQLTAAGGVAERNAWSAAKGALSAQDSLLYNARSVYGLEKGLGSVTPLTPGMDLPPKLFGKFTVPKYGGLGLRAGAGPLTVALIGWELRGKMTDGVMGWTGLGGKDDSVCNETKGGDATLGGAVNWLTDVDCSLWAANNAFVPNPDSAPGVSSGPICTPGGLCVTINNFGSTQFSGSTRGYSCVTVTGGGFTTSDNFLRDPAGRSMYAWVAGSPVDLNTMYGTTVSKADYSMPTQYYGATCGGGANPLIDWGNVSSNPHPILDVGRNRFGWLTTAERTSASYMAGFQAAVLTTSDGDPIRHRVCDQTGSDGLHYVGTTAGYKDSQIKAGTPFPQPVCPPLPAGVTSAHLKITETGVGDPKILLDQDAIADDPEIKAVTGGQSPEIYCRTKICLMDLVDLTKNVSCFSENDACDGWFKDPDRDTKYACNYAGSTVGIAQCALYAHLFNTQKRLSGDPYADPLTGEDTGTANGPSVDRQLMAGIPRASMDGRDCFGAGYNAPNPIQWVLRPLQCEAEWAWMPRESVIQAETVGIQGSWSNTAFGKIDTLMAPFKVMPGFTGCSGLPIDIEETWPMNWGIHWRLGAACDGPLATLAGTVRVVLAGLIGMSGVMVLSDYLGWGIGFRGFGRRS